MEVHRGCHTGHFHVGSWTWVLSGHLSNPVELWVGSLLVPGQRELTRQAVTAARHCSLSHLEMQILGGYMESFVFFTSHKLFSSPPTPRPV